MEPHKYAIFYNDNAGDFAADFREEILSRIRSLESNLKPTGEYCESEKILYYLVILTTLVRHVPFSECLNEFVVLEPDYIRELKVKFMSVWDQQFLADIGDPSNVRVNFESYVKDHRAMAEKTFDDMIEVSENPPSPI